MDEVVVGSKRKVREDDPFANNDRDLKRQKTAVSSWYDEWRKVSGASVLHFGVSTSNLAVYVEWLQRSLTKKFRNLIGCVWVLDADVVIHYLMFAMRVVHAGRILATSAEHECALLKSIRLTLAAVSHAGTRARDNNMKDEVLHNVRDPRFRIADFDAWCIERQERPLLCPGSAWTSSARDVAALNPIDEWVDLSEFTSGLSKWNEEEDDAPIQYCDIRSSAAFLQLQIGIRELYSVTKDGSEVFTAHVTKHDVLVEVQLDPPECVSDVLDHAVSVALRHASSPHMRTLYFEGGENRLIEKLYEARKLLPRWAMARHVLTCGVVPDSTIVMLPSELILLIVDMWWWSESM